MKHEHSIWFITGISRGLGQALAQELLARGETVIGTTRDGTSPLSSSSGRLHVLPLELAAPEQPRQIIEAAHRLYGRLDVVVNNAGYGLLGAIEETNEAEAAHLFQVNFFGALRLVQAALPFLRAQGAGHLVNISSIAALAPQAGSGVYAASKAALGALSESLAAELASSGVRVTCVEPGAFRTDFLSAHSIRKTALSLDAYSATSGESVRYLERIEGRQAGDPSAGARAILQAVRAPEPPLHLVLGADAFRRTRAMLDRMASELQKWESVSLSTGFADAS